MDLYHKTGCITVDNLFNKLFYEYTGYHKTDQDCEEWEKEQRENKIHSLINTSGILPKFRGSTFEDLNIHSQDIAKIKEAALRSYRLIVSGKVVYPCLVGGWGAGKTEIASCILKELILNGYSVKTIKESDLIGKYKNLDSGIPETKEKAQAEFYELKSCKFLFIEETAAADSIPEAKRQDALNYIVDERYGRNLGTGFITNHTKNDFWRNLPGPIQSRMKPGLILMDFTNIKDQRGNFDSPIS